MNKVEVSIDLTGTREPTPDELLDLFILLTDFSPVGNERLDRLNNKPNGAIPTK